MAIVLESTNPAAGRGYVVGVSNLDAAVAQTKAAAALLLAAAAEISKLPNVDVVTDRVSDSAGALAIHASVSADIRDQLSRPVREAFAGLAAACHRWLPKRTTVERAINSAQVSLALTAAFEQDDNVPRHTRVWQWKLPVALNYGITGRVGRVIGWSLRTAELFCTFMGVEFIVIKDKS